MRHLSTTHLPSRQSGATLVIALIILVLIMMIGITAISTSDTQFRLAGNLQFEDSAMNNAETAVSTAEQWVKTNYANAAFSAAGTDPDAASPQVLPLTTTQSVQTARLTRPFSMTWDDTNSLRVGGNTDGNANQRYYLEMLSRNSRLQGSSQVVGGRASAACNQVNTYQVTGRGVSARGATKLVQSYYGVLSCS